MSGSADIVLREKSVTSEETVRRQNDILRHLKDELRNNRLVIVVGAGVTLNATAREDGTFLDRLTWKGLIRNGLDYLVDEGYVDRNNSRIKRAYRLLEDDEDTEGLLDAAGKLKRQLEDTGQFPTWLDSVFSHLSEELRRGAVLTALKALHERGAMLVTTNYDDLLETACGLNRIGRSNKDELLKFQSGMADGVFHLHGSYHEPAEVVLDSIDYYAVVHDDDARTAMKIFLDSKTVLFIGCGSGLEDPNFDTLLSWVAERHKNLSNRHCILLRDGDLLGGKLKVLRRARYGQSYDDLGPYLHRLLDSTSMPHNCGADTSGGRPSNPPLNVSYDAWFKALRFTDPRDDMRRIEDTKGGLLQDSYKWILSNPQYKDWLDDDNDSRLLWISSDPGKGKTMLLIGIIREIHQSLAYFFIQGTDSKLNKAVTVLRGLLYLLFVQQPFLMDILIAKLHDPEHVRFDDLTAIFTLCGIFDEVLQDNRLQPTVLIVDALDECETGLPQLLNFISKHITMPSSRVKWILSSRTSRSEIRAYLDKTEERFHLSLELNRNSISTAIANYIEYQVSQLSLPRAESQIREQIKTYLSAHANGTFLWVALVCQQLQLTSPWNLTSQQFQHTGPWNLIMDSHKFPPGLEPLYSQMMTQILSSESEDVPLFRQILSVMATVYRPPSLVELLSISDLPAMFCDNLYYLRELIGRCASFLTIQDETIYFVHQSAKDYLRSAASGDIFPNGIASLHLQIYLRSLAMMDKTLRRGICDLQPPGVLTEQAPDLEPLSAIAYSCGYWIEHLCQVDKRIYCEDSQCLSRVEHFFRKHFLHWLEAFSLTRAVANAILALKDLEKWLAAISHMDADLLAFIHDAYRFVFFHRDIIGRAPLQVYTSCLLFSPIRCLIRQQFRYEEPKWIISSPLIEDDWSPCLQVLEAHTEAVTALAVSGDGRLLASSSRDRTVRLWDAESGAPLQILETHTDHVTAVALSGNGRQLASSSNDNTVRLWDTESGALLQTLEGHTGTVTAVAFSGDGRRLASSSRDRTVRLWDAESRVLLRIIKERTCYVNGPGLTLKTLERHTDSVTAVAFSGDRRRLASSSQDHTVHLWDTESGALLRILKGHKKSVTAVVYSGDGRRLASSSDDNTVRLWDAESGTLLQILEGHTNYVTAVAFSGDGRQLASSSNDNTVRLWDAESGEPLQILEGHERYVSAVVFFGSGQQLASSSGDGIIRLWDTKSMPPPQTLERHTGFVTDVVFSGNGRWLASSSSDSTVRLWDTESGTLLQTLKGHSLFVTAVAFSGNGRQLASGSSDRTVRLWDTKSWTLLQILKGHTSFVSGVVFSSDGQWLVSSSGDCTVRIWNAESGEPLQTLNASTSSIYTVAFSGNGRRLASGSNDHTVRLWDAESWTLLQILEGHTSVVSAVAFSGDGRWLASSSDDNTVRLWDAESGAPLQTLKAHTRSFSSLASGASWISRLQWVDASRLIADGDMIDIGGDIPSDLQTSQRLGWHLGVHYDWVSANGQRTIWLPPEYRSRITAIKASTIAIGCRSGRVVFLRARKNAAIQNKDI